MVVTLADPVTAASTVALILFGLILAVLALLGPRWLIRRRTLTGTLRVVEDLIEARTERRADPTAKGQLGRLTCAVNTLAAALETRQQQAVQDHDNLAALLEHTNDLIVATDEEDHVQLINPAAARILDRPAASLLGQPLTSLFSHQELLELYRSAYSSDKPVTAAIRLTTPRRPLHCQVTATTMYHGARYRGTLLILRDLTDITQAVQMKTDFVANASHELRTPLASIRAAVETIQESWPELVQEPQDPDAQTVRRCVDIIGGHVLRLQMMVQDLLDLSRTEDPRAVIRMERVDVQHVCELVTGMFAALAGEKRISLCVEIASDARALRGDERLLVLTLKNLVDNSLKFTPAGGHVMLRAYRAPAASSPLSSAPSLSVDGQPALEQLVLEVADTGCGIPPEDQQRVFERFYTVNRSRGGADRGTGLGLAIVKHAVNAMHGTVALESQLNRGTTIRCLFPVAAIEAPSPAPALSPVH